MSQHEHKRVVITGGGGYVGSVLVPSLVHRGYEVTVIDLFIYGEHIFDAFRRSSHFRLVKGDIRDKELLHQEFRDKDCLIHLACISNDPSFDLNPDLGKSINYDACKGILNAIKESSIKRFIYASSSSVYGVSNESLVTETTVCRPLTDYSKYKLLCEKLLQDENLRDCVYTIVRPATVCGYAPRLRLDLTVNILCISGLVKGTIQVFGGNQLRPHIYIEDMISVYHVLLESSDEKIHTQIFNAGYENRSVLKTAELIQNELVKHGFKDSVIDIQKTNDHRSYHIDSTKMCEVLGFKAKHSLKDAVSSLVGAYKKGFIENPLYNPFYYNIQRMKEIDLE